MQQCYIISGRVQGVGFRFWTLRRVKEIGEISGYVCNLSNGDVLVLAAGKKDNIQQLEQALHKGPVFARVDMVKSAPEMTSYFPSIVDGVFKRL